MSIEIPDYMVGPVIYGLGTFIRERHNVPYEVRVAYQRLVIMSAAGHERSTDETELDQDDLIGTAEVAFLLGCSARHVRRLQADLDGAQPAGSTHLVFSRRSVIRYRDAREEHRRRELDDRNVTGAERVPGEPEP